MTARTIFHRLQNDIQKIIKKHWDSELLPVIETPKDESQGEYATTIAMALARLIKGDSMAIGEQIGKELETLEYVEKIIVAKPGFINITMTPQSWQSVLKNMLENGIDWSLQPPDSLYGINIEYVSANPTGPMHVGHGRGAIIGDVLAIVLKRLGYRVQKEYYINDAGTQVDMLAESLYYRYKELYSKPLEPMNPKYYPGTYLIACAENLRARDGDKWLKEKQYQEPLKIFAIDQMMGMIKEDLAAIGVEHDVFSSEKTIATKEATQAILSRWQQEGLIYKGIIAPPKGLEDADFEEREQLLFRATKFGDDIDRPLQKSDGTNTYFLSDIIYHEDKIKRGFKKLINVWGADHKGYVIRMQAAVNALSTYKVDLEIVLSQLVNLKEHGQPIKMSKRAGRFLTLRDVINEVGRDPIRFMMVVRKHDSPLDFDLAQVLEQTKDNPLFYVQYAHARIHSVLRHAASQGMHPNPSADLTLLNAWAELKLIQCLENYTKVLENVAEYKEPHRIPQYLIGLAGAFHALWNKGNEDANLKFLVSNKKLTIARITLLETIATTIKDGLGLLGIAAVEEMH